MQCLYYVWLLVTELMEDNRMHERPSHVRLFTRSYLRQPEGGILLNISQFQFALETIQSRPLI
jgi:hypothetical protein